MFGPHFITFIMCLKFVSFSVSGHLNFIRKIPEFVKLVADCSQMIFCLVMNFLNKQNKFEASIIFKGRIRFWALSLMTQMKNQTHCSAQSPLKWSFSGDEFLPNFDKLSWTCTLTQGNSVISSVFLPSWLKTSDLTLWFVLWMPFNNADAEY